MVPLDEHLRGSLALRPEPILILFHDLLGGLLRQLVQVFSRLNLLNRLVVQQIVTESHQRIPDVARVAVPEIVLIACPRRGTCGRTT